MIRTMREKLTALNSLLGLASLLGVAAVAAVAASPATDALTVAATMNHCEPFTRASLSRV